MSNTWTQQDTPDLTGKTIIVTGANSGIGFEASKEFARNGAHVVMACRNMQKAEAALADLNRDVPNASVDLMQLDLASQKSIHAFAAAYQEKHDKLDVLVNNAGIMMVPYGTTADGFERQFGTNHLGHFALTGLLLDSIKATPGARVVNISSGAHKMGSMDFDDLMYADGKGYSAMGVLPTLRAAEDLATQANDYYDPGGFMEMRGDPIKVQSNAASHNSADQQKLWQASEQLTNVHYP